MKFLKMTTEQQNTFIVNILSTSHQLNDIPKSLLYLHDTCYTKFKGFCTCIF